MKIQFDSIEPTVLQNFYNGDGALVANLFFDGKNKILLGKLAVGSSIGYHIHETSSEIIFILSGEGIVNDNGEEIPLRPGDCHYCPQGQGHSLQNQGKADLIFYAVVPMS